jgi:hypothetical protein
MSWSYEKFYLGDYLNSKKQVSHPEIYIPQSLCLWISRDVALIEYYDIWHGWNESRTTDTQWRHKSKKSENLGRCGWQNMLRPYLKIWEWEWIFGRAVKAISWPGVRSPWNEWMNGHSAGGPLLMQKWFKNH